MNFPRSFAAALAALATATVVAAPAAPPAPVVDSAVVSGLGARNIGSAVMSGRIAAIAGRAEDDGKITLVVGAASGGVWRSLDGGTTFKPVFDKMPSQSIGAIALDPTDPKVIWVGTGESWTRNSVSVGTGLYRSTDGGDSWSFAGLPESERVARILVHPKDGNTVYACVPGKLWSDSADRGLYKTTDAGKTWSLVLKGPNLSTGCASLAMDPRNPDRLFAGLWDFRRKGWTFRSGGEGPKAPSGSGLFLTEDGGKTWKTLDAKSNAGLPPGPWGRLEVAIAPSKPDVVYAVIEGVRSALFRSEDGGKTWEERDRSNPMVWRPFYFSRLVIDPTNPDRVYKPNLRLIASEDGGKSFSTIADAVGESGTHGDHHDLWINPKNPRYVVTGDDGGLWISVDGGNKWNKVNNLPVSQFYHVSVDSRDPYQVYGGLQDNSSWAGDSAYPGGITNNRWENLYGGDGFWAFSDPTDPDYAYAEAQGGNIGRINRHTLEKRDIQPQAGFKEKLRFNWNAPIALSPTDPKKLYIGAQFLFLSRDHGQSWARISPDLTTNDPQKQKQEESGGITVDNSAAEMHTTIYSIAESPRDGNLVWVGTDDGNLQLTQDGGAHWRNVAGNVKGLPPSSWVSWVEAGHFADGTVYAAFDRHTFGDLTPWVYASRDFGQSWTRIVGPGAGVRGYAHVVREDPVNPAVLYVGTEFGLWISVDGGGHWAEFKGGNFPSVAVRDLAFQGRDQDLVIATHGRGLWIVDDLTPLRALADLDLRSEVAFLPSRPIQQRIRAGGGWPEGDATFRGQNPSTGAVISYYQPTRHVFGRIKLEVYDSAGKLVDTLQAGKRKGINRVVWSMSVDPPRVPTAAQAAGAGFSGPRVVPGRYVVRLTKGDKTYEQTLEVGLDRRATFSVDDRKAQFAAVMKAHALFGRMSDLVDRLNGLRLLAQQRRGGLPGSPALRDALQQFEDQVDELRKKVVATKEGGAITGEERLREHLDSAYGALMSYEGRPGDYQVERVAVLERELAEVEADAKKLAETTLPGLNDKLKQAGAEPLALAAADEAGERYAALDALAKLKSGEAAAAATERD
ncbi:MAG: sialidase [Proteobacteria bacterium]|nr:sialidase [Pseudomonadota bacterium]